MWRLTYNLLILLALPFFAAFSLFRPKIRRNFSERLLPAPLPAGIQDAVWIHAASLGEAVIAENLVNYLRRKAPNPFVITTNTYYARDMLRKRLPGAIGVFSLPFDLPCSIDRFLGASRMAALLLVETEMWPNLIWRARARRIPVIIVNGRISDATIGRYKVLAFFLRKVLSSVDLVLAQSEEQARRFVSLGMAPARVVDAGNLKFYREIGDGSGVQAKEPVVTFGSVKERELPVLLPVIEALKARFPHVRVYIAPRELSLVPVLEKALSAAYAAAFYSREKQGGKTEGDVVIVDTVGDLVGIYARSMVAFVGGSLAPYGGQNVLEPLFVGTPVLFGPHVENFKAPAEEILRQGAGYMVEDGEALLAAIARVLDEPETRQALAQAGRRVLDTQKEVMEKAAGLVLETIWKNSRDSSN